MRRFFIDSELWIVPVALFFAVFSVMGLRGFNNLDIKNLDSSSKAGVPLTEIYGSGAIDGPNQMYCRSTLMIEKWLLDDSNKVIYSMVFYDPIYFPWALVDKKTECSKASELFKKESLEKGYKWKDPSDE